MMTSASELFSNWRSRSGARNPNPDPHLAVDPALPSDLRRRPRRRPTRRRLDDCAGPSRHRALEAEHELLQSDNSSPNNSRTGNSSNSTTVTNRVNQLNLIRSGQLHERLPGTVLQARARLLERLHGISLTGNRQNLRASAAPQSEFFVDNNFEFIDSGDWEIGTPREWIEFEMQLTDLSADVPADGNQAMSLRASKKKPRGLSWEAIRSLPEEFFKDAQENDGAVRASVECCICLERFSEGDRLSRLPCYHRFHPSCLQPWLLNCGDCPYCRAII